jgi:hypothetical protein
LLARAEGSPQWRSAVALVSGVLLPAYLLLDVSWVAASFGSADLDLAVASYAFDAGNLGFANVWIAMASFAAGCGWLILSTRVVGRWLGWWGDRRRAGARSLPVLLDIGDLVVPYAAFWIWVIIICILLIRRSSAVLNRADGRGR